MAWAISIHRTQISVVTYGVDLSHRLDHLCGPQTALPMFLRSLGWQQSRGCWNIQGAPGTCLAQMRLGGPQDTEMQGPQHAVER